MADFQNLFSVMPPNYRNFLTDSRRSDSLFSLLSLLIFGSDLRLFWSFWSESESDLISWFFSVYCKILIYFETYQKSFFEEPFSRFSFSYFHSNSSIWVDVVYWFHALLRFSGVPPKNTTLLKHLKLYKNPFEFTKSMHISKID